MNLLKSRLLIINFELIFKFLLIINVSIAILLLPSVIFVTLIMKIDKFIKITIVINFESILRFLLIIHMPIATLLLLSVIFITLIIGKFIKINCQEK